MASPGVGAQAISDLSEVTTVPEVIDAHPHLSTEAFRDALDDLHSTE